MYDDNLMNEEAIRDWVEAELKSNLDVIEDLNQEQIHDLLEENEYVMVYLYTDNCETCDEAIKQLEQIDDDADAVGVKFVKTDEKAFADEYGIDAFPTILYFEGKQPSIYDGDPSEETELLTWMLYQMKEDTVENMTRELESSATSCGSVDIDEIVSRCAPDLSRCEMNSSELETIRPSRAATLGEFLERQERELSTAINSPLHHQTVYVSVTNLNSEDQSDHDKEDIMGLR